MILQSVRASVRNLISYYIPKMKVSHRTKDFPFRIYCRLQKKYFFFFTIHDNGMANVMNIFFSIHTTFPLNGTIIHRILYLFIIHSFELQSYTCGGLIVYKTLLVHSLCIIRLRYNKINKVNYVYERTKATSFLYKPYSISFTVSFGKCLNIFEL